MGAVRPEDLPVPGDSGREVGHRDSDMVKTQDQVVEQVPLIARARGVA